MKKTPFINSRIGQSFIALFLAMSITVLFINQEHFFLIPILLGMLPFGLYFSVSHPYWICLLFIAFSFFRLHEVFPLLYSFKIPQLLALLMFFLLAFEIMFKRVKPYWRKEMGYFCLFFIFVTLGMVVASNFTASFKTWSGTFIKIFITFFAICWLINSPKAFKAAMNTIIASGLLVCMVTLYNKFNSIGLVEGTRVTIGRDIGSLLGDPNDLALVLLFPLSFAMSQFVSIGTSKWYKFRAVIICLLFTLAIIATQSRGGLLGFLAVSGFFFYYKTKSKVAVVLAGVAGFIALMLMAGISERSSGGAHEEGIDESAMGRLYAWKAAIKMAIDNPIFGVGINGFYYNYYSYIEHWTGKNYVVHSTWFGILAETGIVGLILFVTCVYSAFRVTDKSLADVEKYKGKDKSMLRTVALANKAGLISFCVSGAFLTQGFLWPFYILFSLALALSQFLSISQHKDVS